MEVLRQATDGFRKREYGVDMIEIDRGRSVRKVKEKWGKFTDDDIAAINGKRERLEGKIRQFYSHGKTR